MTDKLSRIEAALSGLRLPVVLSEYELHSKIAGVLSDAGFDVSHETPLAPHCRIDFLVDGIGIEVKRGRPAPGRLREQAERYLRSPRLEALLIVVEKNAALPTTILGKPVRVFGLNRLWGIALP